MFDDIIILGIENCGTGKWARGDWMQAAICPYQETVGPLFVVFVGFIAFSGLAIYTRSVQVPAVLAILFAGLMANVLPAMAAWLTMRFVVAVAAALLFLLYLRVK